MRDLSKKQIDLEKENQELKTEIKKLKASNEKLKNYINDFGIKLTAMGEDYAAYAKYAEKDAEMLNQLVKNFNAGVEVIEQLEQNFDSLNDKIDSSDGRKFQRKELVADFNKAMDSFEDKVSDAIAHFATVTDILNDDIKEAIETSYSEEILEDIGKLADDMERVYYNGEC